LTLEKYFQTPITTVGGFATINSLQVFRFFLEATMSPRSKRAFKKRTAFRRHSRQHAGAAFTIPSFCKNNGISESLYYTLKRQDKGPREIELGGRIIITPEAEADWRREREAETAARRREREAAATVPAA
jgi:hypothetical protein